MGIINCFIFELALLIMCMFIKYYNKKLEGYYFEIIKFSFLEK